MVEYVKKNIHHIMNLITIGVMVNREWSFFSIILFVGIINIVYIYTEEVLKEMYKKERE